MVRLGEVSPTIWETIVSEMEIKLKHLDFQGEDIFTDWRKMANKRKFERELFTRYGYFKDIILNPKFQFAKQYLEEHADFNFFLGDSILPLSTAVIVLFMLHKRISYNALSLSAFFIFNINPLYVIIAIIVYYVFRSNGKPKDYISPSSSIFSRSKLPVNDVENCKATSIEVELNEKERTYDHVLIGNDIATLYTAALLSKNGHKCCVLQPSDGPINTVFFFFFLNLFIYLLFIIFFVLIYGFLWF
jgi:hypothetical protein